VLRRSRLLENMRPSVQHWGNRQLKASLASALSTGVQHLVVCLKKFYLLIIRKNFAKRVYFARLMLWYERHTNDAIAEVLGHVG
jgi:hypothetical protein